MRSNFETLLWETGNRLRNVSWFIGAEEVKAKNTHKGGWRMSKRRGFKTPVWRDKHDRGQEWKEGLNSRTFVDTVTGSPHFLSSLPTQPRWEPNDGELQKIEMGYSWHLKDLILSIVAVVLYSFQMWTILPTGSPHMKGFEESLRHPEGRLFWLPPPSTTKRSFITDQGDLLCEWYVSSFRYLFLCRGLTSKAAVHDLDNNESPFKGQPDYSCKLLIFQQ